jgi:hypothetical protein
LSERARFFMQKAADPLLLMVQSSGYINFFKRLPIMSGKFRNVVKARRYLGEFFKQRIAEYKVSYFAPLRF